MVFIHKVVDFNSFSDAVTRPALDDEPVRTKCHGIRASVSFLVEPLVVPLCCVSRGANSQLAFHKSTSLAPLARRLLNEIQ